MVVLPIVTRELLVAARRPAVYRVRLIAAAAAILCAATQWWFQSEFKAPAEIGQTIFSLLSNIAFLFCLAAGPVFTADVLSEERREGTLGLLFLTDLKGYDVVLGKLAASSLKAMLALLAILPVLSVPLILGGVSFAEYGRVALSLGSALVFSLSMGIAVSAFSKHSRSAFAVTVLFVLVVTGVVPWLGWNPAARQSNGPSVLSILGLFSPLHNLESAFERRYGLDFWLSLAVISTGSLALLGAAAIRLPLSLKETPPPVWIRQMANWFLRVTEIWIRKFSSTRGQWLEHNPVGWLSGRRQLERALCWSAVVVGTPIWITFAFMNQGQWHDWTTVTLTAFFFQIAIKWLLTSEATLRWTEDRQSGALELLATTPLTTREILRGQFEGIRQLFGLPVILVSAVELFLLGYGLVTRPFTREVFLAIATIGIFIWDLHTLTWYGTYMGLTRKRANAAFLVTLGRVLVLPWFLFFVLTFLVGEGSFEFVLANYLLACGGSNLSAYWKAKGHLLAHFRSLAAADTSKLGEPRSDLVNA